MGNEGVIGQMNFLAGHLLALTQQLEIIRDCADTQITLAFLIPVNSCNQKVRTELDFQSN